MTTRTSLLAGILGLALGCGQQAAPGTTGFPGMTGVPGMTAMPMPMTAVAMTPAPMTAAIMPAMPGGDFLQNRMNEIYGRFGQGRQPVSQLFRGNLGTQQTQDFSVTITSGHCYTIIGVGTASVTDLDLFLFDQNGTQVAQDQATDNFPIVSACPSLSGAYRVQAKMYAGSGEFGIQVFGS
jgi:hypothetical protein